MSFVAEVTNNIELSNLNVFFLISLVSNKMGVAKQEEKHHVDDIRSFPQSKKLDEYGHRYVLTKNTDPFGEDQEFLNINYFDSENNKRADYQGEQLSQPNSTSTQVGGEKVMGWLTPPTPHHPPTETVKALPDNLGS